MKFASVTDEQPSFCPIQIWLSLYIFCTALNVLHPFVVEKHCGKGNGRLDDWDFSTGYHFVSYNQFGFRD